MWRLIKRWIDWVRDELLPLVRTRRSGFTVHVGYEACGLTHPEPPVPWSADAVVVGVVLRLPLAARRKSDFTLLLPGIRPVPAESLRPEADGFHRITFRFPVPNLSTICELQWKQQTIAPVIIPVLTINEFLSGLTLSNAAVAVRLGVQTVQAQYFVADRCKGLIASVVVHSLHPLVPLADLGFVAEFTNERSGKVFTVPVPLTAAQRSSKEAILTAVCPRIPRRPGVWRVTWRAGDRMLAVSHVEAISAQRFEVGVRLLETRYALVESGVPMRMIRGLPPLALSTRAGPCFLIEGSEKWTAGLCRLSLFAVLPGAPHRAQLLEEEVLITDAPTVFAPGLIESADLVRISAFELRLNERVLGVIPLSLVPHATLTAEGGFKPPQEFDWSLAAEDDLIKRLNQLGGLG